MPKMTDQVIQDVLKELFRLHMRVWAIPRKTRELNAMNEAIMERLLISELAKNKTLTPLSKSELRAEDFSS